MRVLLNEHLLRTARISIFTHARWTMGAANSVPEYASVASSVGVDTLIALESVADALSAAPGDQAIDTHKLEAHLTAHVGNGAAGSILHAVGTCVPSSRTHYSHASPHISRKVFLCAAILAKQGTLYEKAHLYAAALGLAQSTPVSPDQLVDSSCVAVESIIQRGRSAAGRVSTAFRALLASAASNESPGDIPTFLQKAPVMALVLNWMLTPLYTSAIASIPALSPFFTAKGPRSELLDEAGSLVISSSIPEDRRSSWTMLFSSTQHGESFSAFRAALTDAGSTVIVVEDESGHVFGGYAHDSWAVKGTFYGSEKCFLFSISPSVAVYTYTGYNKNFMYLSAGKETLVNGLVSWMMMSNAVMLLLSGNG